MIEESMIAPDTTLIQGPDPTVSENLILDLEITIAGLSLISPFSVSRRPAQQFGAHAQLSGSEDEVFTQDPGLEDNPLFQEIRQRLNRVKTIF
jgi:hypothetical protein